MTHLGLAEAVEPDTDASLMHAGCQLLLIRPAAAAAAVLVSAAGPVCSTPPGDAQSHQRTHCCWTAWPAAQQHNEHEGVYSSVDTISISACPFILRHLTDSSRHVCAVSRTLDKQTTCTLAVMS
jgi:hypothetical protein